MKNHVDTVFVGEKNGFIPGQKIKMDVEIEIISIDLKEPDNHLPRNKSIHILKLVGNTFYPIIIVRAYPQL